MQRSTAFLEHLGTCDFSTVETAADLHLDALGAHAHGGGDSHLHGTAVSHLALDLTGKVGGHELGVEFGTLDLVDIDLHFLVGDLLKFLLQSFHLFALLADDDTGARCADGHGHHLERALDDDSRDTGLCKTSAEVFADFGVLKQGVSILFAAIPV